MKELAEELKFQLPEYCLAKFVQGKSHKMRLLIEGAKTLEECSSGPNKEAVDNMAAFIDAFEKLKEGDISNLEKWREFVGQYAKDGWEERLHFDYALSNFGFDEEVSKKLRKLKRQVEEDKGIKTEKTLEEYSLRWLVKALAGYNVSGCLTDVVNLLFAISGEQRPEEGLQQEVRTPMVAELLETWAFACSYDEKAAGR